MQTMLEYAYIRSKNIRLNYGYIAFITKSNGQSIEISFDLLDPAILLDQQAISTKKASNILC